MQELRYNNLKGIWSVLSTIRGQHRHTFITRDNIKKLPCPFCDEAGNINTSLHNICSFNKPDNSGLSLVVTPNKYPALGIEGVLERKQHALFDRVSAIGAHEIIIDSCKHGIDISGYDEDEIFNLFLAFKYRISDLSRDTRFKSIAAFKNIGYFAGQIIDHPHSQIIAFPIVPDALKFEVDKAVNYFKKKERCIYCDMLENEKSERERIIYENYDFIAIAPYVSEYPFEISIYPKGHNAFFTSLNEASIRQLSDAVFEIFGRFSALLDNPSCTLALRLPPFVDNRLDIDCNLSFVERAFHWHIDIRPIVANITATHWATNLFLNPVTPEEAAKNLREVKRI